eukprot:GGOE01054170.1.p1 GENE.GGOE01054170.1~~GGOE01054170.1.p1  ORF type:complete len:393 (-),score=75.28 GGOE01054170.1:724-1902(-)
MLFNCPAITILHVTCKGFSDCNAWALACLGKLPHVESLTVQLNVHQFGNKVGDSVVSALTSIRNISTLRHLTLDLHCTNGGIGSGRLTNASVVFLESLKAAPALEAFTLDLSFNDVGGPALQSLVTLALSCPLHTLDLNLSSTAVGDTGAEVLSRLRAAPHLRVLRLGLQCTGITNVGASALAELVSATTLHSLTLDLSRCSITDTAVQALFVAAKTAPKLTSFALTVIDTHCFDVSCDAILSLRMAPRLERLALGLGPGVGDDSAHALAMLADAQHLKTLFIDMHRSRLTDCGVASLARLKDAPHLSDLTLDFNGSAISDMGAAHLVALKESQSLQNITLDVSSTCIGRRGFRTLAELQHVRCAAVRTEACSRHQPLGRSLTAPLTPFPAT